MKETLQLRKQNCKMHVVIWLMFLIFLFFKNKDAYKIYIHKNYACTFINYTCTYIKIHKIKYFYFSKIKVQRRSNKLVICGCKNGWKVLIHILYLSNPIKWINKILKRRFLWKKHKKVDAYFTQSPFAEKDVLNFILLS